MASWIQRITGRGRRRGGGKSHRTALGTPGPELELRVVEGADRDRVFRVTRPECAIGRWPDAKPPADTVALADRTVSSRQALVRRDEDGFAIEHCAGARNPTLVNGTAVERARLQPGDRIQLGAVVMEVAIRGLPAEAAGDRDATDPATTRAHPVGGGRDDTTEVRVLAREPVAHLRLLGGVPALGMRRFPLAEGTAHIGRSSECEVCLPDRGISRLHAVVHCRSGTVELEHRSRTNTTEVNGEPVVDRRRLFEGDEIELAGHAVLRLELPQRRGAPARRALLDVMEDRAHLERELADFEHEGSFVDVDVVDSYGMKSGADHASVVVSFERLRGWLRDVAARHAGRFLNSNGDEVMFFFDDADAAVDAAVAVLEELPEFNRARSELAPDFRLRIGIHTGRAAVDLQRGYAYSAILDAAGHIQKAAGGSGGLVVSGETLRALERPRPFEAVGRIERHGIELHRWRGP